MRDRVLRITRDRSGRLSLVRGLENKVDAHRYQDHEGHEDRDYRYQTP